MGKYLLRPNHSIFLSVCILVFSNLGVESPAEGPDQIHSRKSRLVNHFLISIDGTASPPTSYKFVFVDYYVCGFWGVVFSMLVALWF